jgi:hypothetical protein
MLVFQTIGVVRTIGELPVREHLRPKPKQSKRQWVVSRDEKRKLQPEDITLDQAMELTIEGKA